MQHHSPVPCAGGGLGFQDAEALCEVALESGVRAEVRKRSAKKVTGGTTPEVII